LKCFTDTSFVSIVRPKNAKGRKDPLVVRGRVKGDIEALFPKAKVRVTPARDYLYRALVARKVMAEKIMDIDYDNYKDAITDKAKDRHDAYLSLWWELMNLQRGRAGTQKSSSANSARSPHYECEPFHNTIYRIHAPTSPRPSALSCPRAASA
jgi:hypothetical protein